MVEDLLIPEFAANFMHNLANFGPRLSSFLSVLDDINKASLHQK
jgi:hypothetical protein